jgi:hypothetical protein
MQQDYEMGPRPLEALDRLSTSLSTMARNSCVASSVPVCTDSAVPEAGTCRKSTFRVRCCL